MTDVSRVSPDSDSGPTTAVALPAVRVVVTAVEGADISAALASIRRQAYDGRVEVAVVGDHDLAADEATLVESLESAVSGTDADFDYLWILHADARPRPDALVSLVREVERADAGLGASKLLKAGTTDVLESIGSATDVFGEPYTGLDESEIDLQQYDVVREVSYVTSVSMLVRRDLARGLGGLDKLMPPDAAGLDFSQRARIAGAQVIIVPSSEVYHQGRCRAQEGWRERAGRLRAMLIAYRPLTLVWVVPLSLMVGLLDSILNLLLLRWQHLASYIATWAWNLLHLPSTWGARRRANAIRSGGDEELFRFQTSGSVRLRTVGAEISARVLSMFDEDQAITRGAKRMWSSPGIVGALVAVVVALLASRSVIFSGVPNAGMSFPFEPPTLSLQRFVGGWNEAGLGSPAPVHPSVGFTGLISLLWFGAEGAARTLLTIGAGVIAILGMGRLMGRLGLRGSGRYVAGLVAIAGPGTAALTGAGSWTALIGAALLPWALRAVFVHPTEEGRSRLSALGWALIIGWITAAVSPLLVIVPVLAAVIWAIQGGRRSRLLLALATLVGGVAAANFISGDPGWVLDAGRRLGLDVPLIWPGLILVAALPLFLDESRHRRAAAFGGLLALGGLVAFLMGYGGPGFEEATLVTASVGTAIVVGVSLDRVKLDVLPIASALASVAILILSIGSIFNGSMGLPQGDVNDELSFSESLAEDESPRRILFVSTERDLVPGASRSGPGVWYRVLDGKGTTNDEVWLPPERLGDRALADTLEDIATGGVLRPGEALSEFAIGWIVVDGEPSSIDAALDSQLDVIPLPFDQVARVYENPTAAPIALGEEGDIWTRDGLDWVGPESDGRVALSINYTTGWEPDGERVQWHPTVSAANGVASYQPHPTNALLGWVSLGTLAAGLVLVLIGRGRRT